MSTNDTVMARPALSQGKFKSETTGESDFPSTVAVLPFANKTGNKFTYPVVRRTMLNHFSTKNYRMLHWRDVDRRLSLAGLDDVSAVEAKSYEELRQILGVDGLIYGSVTHYNKTFAGVYSQIAVGVELRFVNARDKVIWEVKDIQRSHAGGVSVSPVGIIMNALVATNHLRGDLNLYRAADDLGRYLAEEMPQPTSVSARKKPVITNVVHSGVGQFLKYGDTIEIGIEGSPGMTAVAFLEGIGIVDLTEQASGQYIGKISLDKKHNLTDVAVIGRLRDDFGQTSSWISPYGLVNVDNISPESISALRGESKNNAMSLTWNPPTGNDIAGYTVSYARTENGPAIASVQSSNSAVTLGELNNFQTIYISVSAFDRAGNQGEAVWLKAIPAPDSRFSAARPLATALPSSINGIAQLTLEASPYYLRGKSIVATNGVLLIAPGVEIIVSPNARLSVMGEIHAFGNRQHPIIVNSEAGQNFDEFLILQSTQAVSLKGLKVNGAGIPIQITAGKPLISDCALIDSKFNGLTISGSARPIIRNCTISGARASGVIVSGQAQPTFEGNRFLNNDPFQLQNASSYQIDVRGNSFEPPISAMTFLGDIKY